MYQCIDITITIFRIYILNIYAKFYREFEIMTNTDINIFLKNVFIFIKKILMSYL